MSKTFTPEELDGLRKQLAWYSACWGEEPSIAPHESAPGITTGRVIIDANAAAAAIAFLLDQLAHKTQAQTPSADAMQAAFYVWSKASGDFDWSKLLRAAYEADDVVPRARLSECEREKETALEQADRWSVEFHEMATRCANAERDRDALRKAFEENPSASFARAAAAEREASALREALLTIEDKDSVLMPCENSQNCYLERGPLAKIARAALNAARAFVAPPPGTEEGK